MKKQTGSSTLKTLGCLFIPPLLPGLTGPAYGVPATRPCGENHEIHDGAREARRMPAPLTRFRTSSPPPRNSSNGRTPMFAA